MQRVPARPCKSLQGHARSCKVVQGACTCVRGHASRGVPGACTHRGTCARVHAPWPTVRAHLHGRRVSTQGKTLLPDQPFLSCMDATTETRTQFPGGIPAWRMIRSRRHPLMPCEDTCYSSQHASTLSSSPPCIIIRPPCIAHHASPTIHKPPRINTIIHSIVTERLRRHSSLRNATQPASKLVNRWSFAFSRIT